MTVRELIHHLLDNEDDLSSEVEVGFVIRDHNDNVVVRKVGPVSYVRGFMSDKDIVQILVEDSQLRTEITT